MLLDDVPNLIHVDPVVSMNRDISKAGHSIPRDLRVYCGEFGWKPLGYLTYDLKIANDGILCSGVSHECFAAISCVGEDLLQRFVNVYDREQWVLQRGVASRSTRSLMQ